MVDRVFFNGISDRNYFGLEAAYYISQQFSSTGQVEEANKSNAHPILDYNYVTADPWLGGEIRWNTNALSFSADENPTLLVPVGGTQQMNRIITEIAWRKRFIDPIGVTYTPFTQLRGDIYQLSDYVDPQDPMSGLHDTSLARGLALAGLTVTYPWVANASYGSHVIEPIGQIIARQASIDQKTLPNEDAKSLVFDDTNLFDVNKFSGYDRIETGTRANVGLQYTFQANYGGYARILAGESFQLAGTNPYNDPGVDANGNPVFTPESGLQTDRSDYVLGAYLEPFSIIQLISQSRFNENSFALERQDAGSQVTVGPFSGGAVYSYLASDPTNGILTAQQEVSGQIGLKITDRWSVAAAVRYDLEADRAGIRHGPSALCRRVLRAHCVVHGQPLPQPDDRRRADAHGSLRAEASGIVRLLDQRA